MIQARLRKTLHAKSLTFCNKQKSVPSILILSDRSQVLREASGMGWYQSSWHPLYFVFLSIFSDLNYTKHYHRKAFRAGRTGLSKQEEGWDTEAIERTWQYFRKRRYCRNRSFPSFWCSSLLHQIPCTGWLCDFLYALAVIKAQVLPERLNLPHMHQDADEGPKSETSEYQENLRLSSMSLCLDYQKIRKMLLDSFI